MSKLQEARQFSLKDKIYGTERTERNPSEKTEELPKKVGGRKITKTEKKKKN